MSEQNQLTCVDCGTAILVCDHAAQRMLDPTITHSMGVEEELREQLAEAEARAASLADELAEERERNAPLRARIKEVQEAADRRIGHPNEVEDGGWSTIHRAGRRRRQHPGDDG